MMRLYIKLAITMLLTAFSAVSFGAEHIVKMLNNGKEGQMVFEPSVLKINAGDSVTFKATDGGHNSASIPGLIPEGGQEWQGNLNQDLTVKFDKEGVYVYQCTPHVMLAMVGVIAVGKATNLEKVVADSASVQFVMNKDRLKGYLASLK